MNIVLRTGFQAITHDISFYSETEVKVKKMVKASHVKRVEVLGGFNGHKLIKSSVIPFTSINDPPHKVSLEVWKLFNLPLKCLV